MGELIRNVSNIKIGNDNFDIEVNESTNGTIYKDIHIQNPKFRLCVPENEFLAMLGCVMLAKKQLDIIKKGDNNE